MPVYAATAHKRWDPEKRTLIRKVVRAGTDKEAESKLTAIDLVDIQVRKVQGMKAVVAYLKADII